MHFSANLWITEDYKVCMQIHTQSTFLTSFLRSLGGIKPNSLKIRSLGIPELTSKEVFLRGDSKNLDLVTASVQMGSEADAKFYLNELTEALQKLGSEFKKFHI